jgi:hypothetical protein
MKQTKWKGNDDENQNSLFEKKKKKLSVDSSWSYKPGVFIVFYGTERFLATFSDDIFFSFSLILFFAFLPIVIGDPLLQTGMIIKERKWERDVRVGCGHISVRFVRSAWVSLTVNNRRRIPCWLLLPLYLFELYIFV